MRGCIRLLSKAWVGFLVLSLVCGLLTGRLDAVTTAVTTGASETVSLTLRILGIMSLWSGFLELISRSGLTEKLSHALLPLLRFLFGQFSEDRKAMEAVSANITANLLGLSNAATPMGLLAADRLYALGKQKNDLSAVRTLILLNTTSLQLFPSTVAAIRAQYGALSPYDIIPAVWGTSAASIAVVLLLAKLTQRKESRWNL